MKALTLTQPWATLVAIGAKKIETRSWTTKYRGPLAIHAAKGFPQYAWDLCGMQPFKDVLIKAGIFPRMLPVGCIVATCELVGVDQFGSWINEHNPMLWGGSGKPVFELTEQERAFGDYSIGRYGFFLANVKRLKTPVPARGSLGLWDWEGSL